MFILMSKKAAEATPPPTNSAAQSSSRTQNACDACRIRKSKCDGHSPCGQCRAKQRVCTFSRRAAKALGPVTAEHVATLQTQQTRLARAISNMAEVIKLAEMRGFSEAGNVPSNPQGSQLSASDLSDVLQRFAPDTEMSDEQVSQMDGSHLPTKKRKFQDGPAPIQQTEDVRMDGTLPAQQTSNERFERFQEFLATVQQHSGRGLDATSSNFQPADAAFEAERSQTTATTSMSFAVPANFEFHPQLAPFVDLIDWDTSLEHFLDSQRSGDSHEWADFDTMF